MNLNPLQLLPVTPMPVQGGSPTDQDLVTFGDLILALLGNSSDPALSYPHPDPEGGGPGPAIEEEESPVPVALGSELVTGPATGLAIAATPAIDQFDQARLTLSQVVSVPRREGGPVPIAEEAPVPSIPVLGQSGETAGSEEGAMPSLPSSPPPAEAPPMRYPVGGSTPGSTTSEEVASRPITLPSGDVQIEDVLPSRSANRVPELRPSPVAPEGDGMRLSGNVSNVMPPESVDSGAPLDFTAAPEMVEQIMEWAERVEQRQPDSISLEFPDPDGDFVIRLAMRDGRLELTVSRAGSEAPDWLLEQLDEALTRNGFDLAEDRHGRNRDEAVPDDGREPHSRPRRQGRQEDGIWM